MAQSEESKQEYIKAWRARNPEKVRAYKDKWKKRNPDKMLAYKKKNREKMKELAELGRTLAEKKPVTAASVSVTKQPGMKICINCGGFFEPKRVTARYCGDRCRVAYNRRQDKK